MTNKSYTPKASFSLDDNKRDVEYFSSNFASLAGILCVGYFLHPAVTSITKNAKYPEKNVRDVTIGYVMAFVCLTVVGVFGYFGFKGVTFTGYYVTNKTTEINQNCLNMFESTNPVAFAVRLVVFFMLFTTFPLVNVFLKSNILNLSFFTQNVDNLRFHSISTLQLLLPLLFALVYPNVGTILALVGSIAGFFIIYLLPPMVHLNRLKIKIENPLLSEALDMKKIKYSPSA